MKTTSLVSRFVLSVLSVIAVAILFVSAFGLTFGQASTISGGLFVLHQVISPKGVFGAGLYPELWTGELVNKFRHEKSWLGTIPRRDELVKNNTIHLVDVGADPNVLVNNTAYPIAAAQRADADIAITLDKFDTENTIITDDELYGLPYDKEGSVIQDHRLALEDKTATKSAHSIAPSSNAAGTPIIPTTGAADGRANARKKITEADIILAQEKLNILDVPMEGRVLVLSAEHYADLLSTSEVFANQIKNIPEGKLLPSLYGFKIYMYNRVPVYTLAGGNFTKKAFGAAADAANEYKGSFFFYNQRAFQSVGTAEMYYAAAKNDPQNRRTMVGFRLYHICLPKKTTGFGVIVSNTTV